MRTIFNIFFLNKVVMGFVNSIQTIYKRYMNHIEQYVNNTLSSKAETRAAEELKKKTQREKRTCIGNNLYP